MSERQLNPIDRDECLRKLEEICSLMGGVRRSAVAEASWKALFVNLVAGKFDFRMLDWDVGRIDAITTCLSNGSQICVDFTCAGGYPFRAKFEVEVREWVLVIFQGGCPVCFGVGMHNDSACTFCDGIGFAPIPL